NYSLGAGPAEGAYTAAWQVRPLRFHPQAEQEYLTALAWYQERSFIAALNFESAFEQAVGRIREAPER
ncbi:MAG TPA: hypothetical protein VGU64_17270, partial [Terriglobales bacterium]|nr:hypothetical protein [Terriglobales bacterium]